MGPQITVNESPAKKQVPAVEATSVPLMGHFVKGYIVTMRPYLLFVSGITGLLGLSMAPRADAWTALPIFFAAFLSYGFGQALTDCFQTDTDSLSSPYRPLVRGTIKRGDVMLVSVVGLISCISCFMVLYPPNLILGGAAGAGLATYTWFKRRWWGGPWYNSWIVVALCAMAMLAGSKGEIPLDDRTTPFALLTVFFGYANFVLTGYFKDITADAATGYRTLPVVFGMPITARISHALAAATVICALVAAGDFGLSGLLFLSAGAFSSVKAQLRLRAVNNDSEAYTAIVPVVHSYILLLSGIVAARRADWAVPLVLFYTAFLWTMAMRPAKNQI